MTTLFWLLVGHFVADYPLQTEPLAVGKNRSIAHSHLGVPWYAWLVAHAAVHAGAAALASGSVAIGCVEFVAHAAIDHGKCSRWYGFHTDQALHIACKLAYAIALVWMAS